MQARKKCLQFGFGSGFLSRLSLFFACHTMAAKLKMFASHVCVWLRFIFHVGHSIVFDTTHATRWHTHTQSWTRAGERARDSTQSVLCQITNKYHAWPKAAIKAINWQRATPGRCQCDDKQSMAYIVEDPDAHTHTHTTHTSWQKHTRYIAAIKCQALLLLLLLLVLLLLLSGLRSKRQTRSQMAAAR